MRCIGSGNEAYSGLCFIHCPHGTGKTTTIIKILGKSIRHSFHDHFGRPLYQSILSKRQKMRCARECMSLHVLVVGSSNADLGSILWRFYADGIPDGQDGRIDPVVVRIKRRNQEIETITCILNKGLDTMWTDLGVSNLLTWQVEASHVSFQFFSTASSARGTQFLTLRQSFCVFIHDEATTS